VISIASRLARIIGLLVLFPALFSVLAGCSAIKLGYNNSDDLAYWWLDSYLDFTDEQAPRVREDLTRLHRWHRTSELPQFALILADMERMAPSDVTPAQACGFVVRVRERLESVAEQAEPAITTFALGATSEQLAHLERKYEKVNAAFTKEWVQLPAGERADKRFDQFVERSEMIYGTLEEPQLLVLRREMQQTIFDPKRVLHERKRRQRDALQTLKQLAGQPVGLMEARRVVRGFLERMQQPADPAALSYQQGLIDEGCRTFAALHNSTTAAQRELAVRRLRAYQRDLRELAAQR
jgi:hypothetical protein